MIRDRRVEWPLLLKRIPDVPTIVNGDRRLTESPDGLRAAAGLHEKSMAGT
jgi:hypothetical protein